MAMVNVADAGGVMLQMPLQQAVQGMIPAKKGYAIGKPVPLDPKNAGKDLVLGEEVPIEKLKVGKTYDVVFADDLSTLHREIYRKYPGTVKSVDRAMDGTTTATLDIPPIEPGVVFHKDGGLFFKKPGTNYGGRRTKKQKNRSRRTRRR